MDKSDGKGEKFGMIPKSESLPGNRNRLWMANRVGGTGVSGLRKFAGGLF